MDKEKLKKLAQELERLKAIKDGGTLAGLLYDAINRMQDKLDEIETIKGDKGDMPQKGIDYWTDKEINQIIREITKEIQSSLRIPKDGERGKDADEDKIISKVLKRISKPRDGKDADENRIIEEIIKRIPIPENGIDGADGSPDTPEQIVLKLESLEDEARLDVRAIKGLREIIKDIRKQIDDKLVYVGGGTSGGGRIVRSYDLSAQLDGSTKTFNLPSVYRVISVHLSSFPNILRPTTDYTVSGNSITFTSEIDAATSLAKGQTALVVYSEK